MMKALIEILAAVAKWFFGDRQQEKRAEAKRQDAAQGAVEAVKTKDVDKVNAILHGKLCMAMIGVAALASCATVRPVYIAESDKVFPVVIEGKAGWFVPDPVFEKMMQKIGGL
jgi:hypothetical protein